MRFRTPLTTVASLAAVTLTLAACTDSDAGSGTGQSPPAGDDALADDDVPADDVPADDVPDRDAADDVSDDDVPDDVAARVGSTEISVATVESIYDEIAGTPSAQAQLDGDDSDGAASMLRAQVVSRLVVREIIEQAAADDFGVEVTDADLDASLADLEDETAGQGGLDATLESAGLTREAFEELELPMIALLDRLESEFGDLEPDPDAEPGTVPEGQAELQAWGVEKFGEADVAVASDYGTWDPATGQVMPAGVSAAPSPGDPDS